MIKLLRVEVSLTDEGLLSLQHVHHIRTGQSAQSRSVVGERDDLRR